MTDPNVLLMCWFRSDADRYLEARVDHLLSKTYSRLRYLFVVGDSEDDTHRILTGLTKGRRDVTVVQHDTGIEGNDPVHRMRRLTATMNAALGHVNEADDYCLLHESDLRSPPDVVERFLATGLCPLAGWPTLTIGPTKLFYDTYVFRRDGTSFSNGAPYHACYKPDEPFEVDSAGSVIMFHAADVREGARSPHLALLGFCEELRKRGRSIWVDPRIEIVQPVDLWVPQAPTNDR